MTVSLKRKGNTSIRTVGDDTIVRYYQTDIVAFDDRRIVLDSGGWRTVSTKDRMNQASREFGLEFDVYQQDFVWYIAFAGKPARPFRDGITLWRADG